MAWALYSTPSWFGTVSSMHIVVVPILLGRGERPWDGLEGLEKDYEIEATFSPSGVTHVTFSRAGVGTVSVDNPGRGLGSG